MFYPTTILHQTLNLVLKSTGNILNFTHIHLGVHLCVLTDEQTGVWRGHMALMSNTGKQII